MCLGGLDIDKTPAARTGSGGPGGSCPYQHLTDSASGLQSQPKAARRQCAGMPESGFNRAGQNLNEAAGSPGHGTRPRGGTQIVTVTRIRGIIEARVVTMTPSRMVKSDNTAFARLATAVSLDRRRKACSECPNRRAAASVTVSIKFEPWQIPLFYQHG